MEDIFDFVNPLDFRYYGRNEKLKQDLGKYFSENARIKYQARVELALIKALAKRKICSQKAVDETKKAIEKVTAKEVYEEEDKIKHDIRALVNCIRNYVSEDSKRFIHLGMTSNDVINTADSLRFKDAAFEILLPELKRLEKTLIDISLREKSTLQIGRTHGQHAEPITFGFALSSYVHRLGERILQIEIAANNLKGKIAGAVGAYNASFLLIKDPVEFEKDVLKELGLEASLHSTQIVPPEYLLDLLHAINSAMGVLANLADDLRHLQRSEISEVYEFFEEKQVGSSTMPHKRNPINFENVKSFWKEFMPRAITFYMDQISEHQRDLTNSASLRFMQENFIALYLMSSRLNKSIGKLKVDKENMLKNFNMSVKMIPAEPLYILLSFHGHKNAHEKVRELTLKAEQNKTELLEEARKDKELADSLKKFSKEQIAVIENPKLYTGLAEKKTEIVCNYWKKKINL
ncbi:MAG: adenylosuccinate lyase [archaeon]